MSQIFLKTSKIAILIVSDDFCSNKIMIIDRVEIIENLKYKV